MTPNDETMDHAIELTPEGLRVRNWNTEEGTYEFEVISPDDAHDFQPFLWRPIQIGENVKLKHLFELIDVQKLELLEFMIGESIQPYLEEAQTTPGDDEAALEGMKYLEVYNDSFEVINGEGSVEGFDISRSFHGYGQWESSLMLPDAHQDGGTDTNKDANKNDQEATRDEEYGSVDVDFIPTHQLVELPLRYDSELHLQETEKTERGEVQQLQEFHTHIPITLIELLQAIFWEINLHGSPEQRDQTYQELNQGLHDAFETMKNQTSQNSREVPELDPKQLIQSLEDELKDPPNT